MKKLHLLSLSALGVLALTGCSLIPGFNYGKESNSNNNSSGQPLSSDTTLVPPDIETWSLDIQEEMLEALGEVLPYAPLNEESLYHGLDDTWIDFGLLTYFIGDDNEVDVLSEVDYGSKLEESGFEYTYDAEYNSVSYIKELDDGTILEAVFGYIEATEDDDFLSGNEIDVYIFSEDIGGGVSEDDEDLIPYMESIVSYIFGAGEDLEDYYEYDSDYSVFYTYFSSEGTDLLEDITLLVDELVDNCDLEVIYEPFQITYADESDGYNAYLGTGLDDDIVIDVYNWLDEEQEGVIVTEIDIYHGEIEDPGTGGEGTGNLVEDDEGNIIATLDFTTMTDGAVFTTQTVGEATYSCTKGTNNDPTYYANGETLRVYYGSTFTFSVSEGYEIVAVGLSIETDDSNSKIKDFSVLEWTNAETEVLMNSCVASAIDGNEDVSFYVTGTGGHLRFTQISVVYRVVE